MTRIEYRTMTGLNKPIQIKKNIGKFCIGAGTVPMALWGSVPSEYAAGVRAKSSAIYSLLLVAARPVLHYGTEAEAS